MCRINKNYLGRMCAGILSIICTVLLINFPVRASEESTVPETISLDEPAEEESIPDLVPEDALDALLEQISISPDSQSLNKPEGNAEVIENTGDDVREKSGKEFFTIKTRDEHTYFLVIDHDLSTDNVYFLDQVTEKDLAGMLPENLDSSDTANESNALFKNENDSKEAKEDTENSTVTAETVNETTPGQDSNAQKRKPSGEKSGSMALIIIFVTAVLAAGYYVKIYKPKRKIIDDALDFDEDFVPDFGMEDGLEDDEEDIFQEESEEDIIEQPMQPHRDNRQQTQEKKIQHEDRTIGQDAIRKKSGSGNILMNAIVFLLKFVFGGALLGLISLGLTVLLNEDIKNIIFETLRNCFR